MWFKLNSYQIWTFTHEKMIPFHWNWFYSYLLDKDLCSDCTVSLNNLQENCKNCILKHLILSQTALKIDGTHLTKELSKIFQQNIVIERFWKIWVSQKNSEKNTTFSSSLWLSSTLLICFQLTLLKYFLMSKD